MSGLNAPDVPLYPADQTGPPAVLDTPASRLELPTSGLDTVDHAVVRMVVSDHKKALSIFEEHGTLVLENDVLMLEHDNKPGTLSEIAKKLAAEKVNIEYAYLATAPNAEKGVLIFRPNNLKKAFEILS